MIPRYWKENESNFIDLEEPTAPMHSRQGYNILAQSKK